MGSFSFRLRFLRSPRGCLNIESPRWEIALGDDGHSMVLASTDGQTDIKDATALVLAGHGWLSADEASAAATRFFPAAALTLARLRIGADYGLRAPKGYFTAAGLAWLEEQRGGRVLNDEHGLMIYESEPRPGFASSDLSAVRVVTQERFEAHFTSALEQLPQISDREQLALVLFNSSLFQDSADSRFLLLMMAVEAMLDPPLRSEAARGHVESLISATDQSTAVSDAEKESLLGSLRWLRRESISQTGRDLATNRLGHRTYMSKSPAAFFTHCYGVRSRLVHGYAPFPTREVVDAAAAQLEVFVADILAGPCLGFEE